MATIKDIAKALQLNTSTISRALSGKPGVSEETRALIKKTASEMNYRPNRYAQTLVTSSSKTVGFMIPDISDSFFSSSAYGVEAAFSESGYSLNYFSVQRSIDKVCDFFKKAEEYRYDGIFITPESWDAPIIAAIDRIKIPVISLRRKTPDFLTNNVPYVDSDHIGGVDQSIDYLYSLGHRKIGYIGFDTIIGKERIEGYIRGMEKRGLEPTLIRNHMEYNTAIRAEQGYKSTSQLLRTAPDITAILGGEDYLAIGALQYLKEHHYSVPSRISVMGFDDRDICDLFSLQLSTVHQQLYEIGYKAGRMMLDMIDGALEPPRDQLVETTLTIRSTTGPI